MRIGNKLIFLFILFVCLSYSLDEVFSKPLYVTGHNLEYQVKTRTSQNTMCMLGFFSKCKYESVNVTKHVPNQMLFEPFKGNNIKELYNYGVYDVEDWYAMSHYNLTELKACSRNSTEIKQIYDCVTEFNLQTDCNCMVSSSAFKIAYYNSKMFWQGNKTYSLIKVYAQDSKSTHRFSMLVNSNGYYVLDPLSCTLNDFDECVSLHTRIFYQDESSPTYRSKIIKIQHYV